MKRRGCESVGIDLGTTYSTMAYLDAQLEPQVVCDASGQMATPSVIYFDDSGVVVGEPAVQQSKIAADRVAQFIKVYMGDPYEVEYLGHRYTPESLSAIILRHLVQEAEPQIGPIRSAVITVPAYFTERRRRATEQAGRIAGLEVMGILNEPMAATLAYGLYRCESEQNVVVYDLGGGTFDVTVVHISPQEICELATCGNRKLGGRDWDRALFEHLADRFRAEQGVELREDHQAAQELQLACEQAKRNLSRVGQAAIRAFAGNRSQVFQVTREEFERLTCHLVQSTRLTTEMALEDAGLNWGDIARVVLVGGSTQLPAVRSMLKELAGRDPDVGVHPVTAVAMGAAIYAYQLEAGRAPQTLRQLPAREEPSSEPTGEPLFSPLLAQPIAETPAGPRIARFGDDPAGAEEPAAADSAATGEEFTPALVLPRVHFVTAHGVGVRTRRGSVWRNSVLIPKNSRVPVEVTRRFVTAGTGRGGSHVKLLVTQGDTPDPDLAEVLGQGRIEGLSGREPAGQPVDVIMQFDESGRLHIRAVYCPTGRELTMELDIPHGLRAEEVERQREHLQNTPFLTLYRGDSPDGPEEEPDAQAEDEQFFLSAE